jgi:hypothetical protein
MKWTHSWTPCLRNRSRWEARPSSSTSVVSSLITVRISDFSSSADLPTRHSRLNYPPRPRSSISLWPRVGWNNNCLEKWSRRNRKH